MIGEIPTGGGASQREKRPPTATSMQNDRGTCGSFTESERTASRVLGLLAVGKFELAATKPALTGG